MGELANDAVELAEEAHLVDESVEVLVVARDVAGQVDEVLQNP